jgi:hypothetical protein
VDWLSLFHFSYVVSQRVRRRVTQRSRFRHLFFPIFRSSCIYWSAHITPKSFSRTRKQVSSRHTHNILFAQLISRAYTPHQFLCYHNPHPTSMQSRTGNRVKEAFAARGCVTLVNQIRPKGVVSSHSARGKGSSPRASIGMIQIGQKTPRYAVWYKGARSRWLGADSRLMGCGLEREIFER